jgi:hypothetical protein
MLAEIYSMHLRTILQSELRRETASPTPASDPRFVPLTLPRS